MVTVLLFFSQQPTESGRQCLKQKMPKIYTLDALGDEITTILTANLDNNPDNQFWQQYRQQSQKPQKTIHVEKYNIDIPLICLIFDKISSAAKKCMYLYLSKKSNLSASLRPSLAKDLLPKQLQAEFNTTFLTNIFKHSC